MWTTRKQERWSKDSKYWWNFRVLICLATSQMIASFQCQLILHAGSSTRQTVCWAFRLTVQTFINWAGVQLPQDFHCSSWKICSPYVWKISVDCEVKFVTHTSGQRKKVYNNFHPFHKICQVLLIRTTGKKFWTQPRENTKNISRI